MTSFAKTKKRQKLDEQQQHLLQDRAGSNAMQSGDRLQSALQKQQQLNPSPLESLQVGTHACSGWFLSYFRPAWRTKWLGVHQRLVRVVSGYDAILGKTQTIVMVVPPHFYWYTEVSKLIIEGAGVRTSYYGLRLGSTWREYGAVRVVLIVSKDPK